MQARQGLLLKVEHLNKRYVQRKWLSRNKFTVTALDDVSLSLHAGCTLALVGQSGSGKSTLARCLTRLTEPDCGEIFFQDRNLLTLSRRDLAAARCQIQLVFQDAASAMNPRFSAAEIVEEPFRVRGWPGRRERRREAVRMLERVGIDTRWADRRCHEFSGGQRQRLVIARALMLNPAILILDEALAGLDLSIQAQIANLLADLQVSLSLAYLYISHDLRMAAHLADEIAVMDEGKIIESAETSELFTRPRAPQTRALIASIPGQEQAS